MIRCPHCAHTRLRAREYSGHTRYDCRRCLRTYQRESGGVLHSRQTLSPEEAEVIRAWRESGATYAHIAGKLGWARDALSRALAEHDIGRDRPHNAASAAGADR